MGLTVVDVVEVDEDVELEVLDAVLVLVTEDVVWSEVTELDELLLVEVVADGSVLLVDVVVETNVEVELLVDVLDVDAMEVELVEVVEEVLLVVDVDVDDVLDVDVDDEVVVVGFVHAPKLPTCPALFCGVGQRSAKSVALSSVLAMRVSEKVPSPGASGVGVPDPVRVVPV